MYNQEIKERYLAAVAAKSSQREVMDLQRIFDHTESPESAIQKDIVQMTKDEAVNAVVSMNINETSSVRSALSYLKNYARWCQEARVFENVDAGILSVNVADIDLSSGLSMVLFRDDRALLSALRQVMPFDEGRFEIPGMILSWLGLSRAEIDSLKDEQVDLDARTIRDPSGNIIVHGFSDEIHEALDQYVRCRVRYIVGGRGGKPYPMYKDFTFDRFLKRFYAPDSTKKKKAVSAGDVQSLLNRRNEEYEALGNPPRLTLRNAWRSGCFYRLWQVEKTGVDVCAPKNKEILESITRKLKARRDVVNTYQAYKKGFRLSVDT